MRIALYFPGDRDNIKHLIETHFNVDQIKEFPEQSRPIQGKYNRTFSGYAATHYRVYMHEELLNDIQQLRYCNVCVEIQVASVLMHAWSEVEHDLVYKPETGEPSMEEYAILDEINGMVLAGEIALQRLQGAVKQRQESEDKPFSSSYQLAAYIHDNLRARTAGTTSEIVVGHAVDLLGILHQTKRDRPKLLAPYLDRISADVQDGLVADQLIRLLRKDYPEIRAVISSQSAVTPLVNQTARQPYWVLPAGNTDTSTASESLKLWLDRNIWGMRQSTPGRKHLRIGDYVCFYAAKVGVVAVAEIAGESNQFIAAADAPEPINDESVYRVPLKNVRWLPRPIPLDKDLRIQLDAFKGRNPNGIWAWFIQSTRNVTEHDFRLLTTGDMSD